MQKPKTILIALGFSEYSKGIFEYGIMLAEALDADILIANIINSRDVDTVDVITTMGYDVDGEHYLADVRKARQKILDDFMKEASYPLERMRSLFRVGNPIDELLKIILTEKVDMIVMGTKGRTDLAHVLIGSVAEKVFRRSPVPVVSFRDEKTAEHMRQRIHIE
ncbi:MAG: universal stress protein [Thermodesulfobacteriota bacterium]